MKITQESLQSILLYDTSDVSILIQNDNLYIEWKAMGQRHQLCFVDCIYFEWIDNQTSVGLHGISLAEISPLAERLVLQSDRLREMRDYKMYHLQIGNLYGECLNLVCHDVEPVVFKKT